MRSKFITRSIFTCLISIVSGAIVADQEHANELFSPFNPNYVLLGADSKDLGFNDDEIVCDIKFQISFASRIRSPLDKELVPITKLIDTTGPLYFAYTQESYWDICRDSAPFRESNYRPEFFFKTKYKLKNRYVDSYFGYEHESNGRDGKDSGSWDRVYYRIAVPFGQPIDDLNIKSTDRSKWILDAKIWIPFSISSNNSRIADFAGYGEISTTYTPNKDHRLRLTIRKGGGFKEFDKGLAELDWIFQIPGTDLQGLFQYVNGYGASLERFEQHEWSARVGILFADFSPPVL